MTPENPDLNVNPGTPGGVSCSDLLGCIAQKKLIFLMQKDAKILRTVLEIKMPDGHISTLDSFGRYEYHGNRRPKIRCPVCRRIITVSGCGIHSHYGPHIGLYCAASGKPATWQPNADLSDRAGDGGRA